MNKDQSSAPLTQPPAFHVIVLSAIFLFFALLILLALFSYDPADPAWRHNSGDTVNNTLGTLGAWYSDLSFSLIGKMSYLIPMAMLTFIYHGWRDKMIEKEIFSWRLFMLLTAVLSGSVLWATHDTTAINSIAQTGGGAVGSWLVMGLERSVQSISVIMAFSLTIFIISISLVFDIPWGRLADMIGAGVSALFASLFANPDGIPNQIRKTASNLSDATGIQEKIKGLNKSASKRQAERQQNDVAMSLAKEAGIAFDDDAEQFARSQLFDEPAISDTIQIEPPVRPQHANNPSNYSQGARKAQPQIVPQTRPQIDEAHKAEPNFFSRASQDNTNAHTSQYAQPQIATQQTPSQRDFKSYREQQGAQSMHAQHSAQDDMYTQSQGYQPQQVASDGAQNAHVSPMEQQQAMSSQLEQLQQAQQQAQSQPVQQPQSAPQQTAPQSASQSAPKTLSASEQASRVAEWLEDIDRVASRNARNTQKSSEQTVDDLLESLKAKIEASEKAREKLGPIPEARPKVASPSAIATPTASPAQPQSPANAGVNTAPQASPAPQATPTVTPAPTPTPIARPTPIPTATTVRPTEKKIAADSGRFAPSASANTPQGAVNASQQATQNTAPANPQSGNANTASPVSGGSGNHVASIQGTVPHNAQQSAPNTANQRTAQSATANVTPRTPQNAFASEESGEVFDTNGDERTAELLSKIETQVVNQSVAEPTQAQQPASIPATAKLGTVEPYNHLVDTDEDDDLIAQTVVHPRAHYMGYQPVSPTPAPVLADATPTGAQVMPTDATPNHAMGASTPVSPVSTPTIAPVASPVPMATERGRSHELPSIQLLDVPPPSFDAYTEDTLAEMAGVLETTLQQFKINAIVMRVSPGPVITRFELELAPGIPAKKITALSKDLARALAVSGVRVEEVVPGSSYVGLEVPNKERQTVYFRDIVGSKIFQESQSPLSISLGSDTSGKPQVVDLMKMPHALVAGTTGSGKSVCINVMLLSLLFKATPKDVRLILVDPKMLELSMYEDIPHLLTPVITDMNEAENALTWAVGEMERRYQLMAALKVRKIDAFNAHVDEANAKGEPLKDPLWQPDEHVGYTHHPTLERLPYIVIVIDELADMMMVVGKQVEQLIARLTQKARAAGIHVVLATQRPSTDVITGLIKANVPTRLAFQVSSQIDSRVIIDEYGAEKLLGNGDMLYVPPGASHPQRLHGAFVGDAETDRVTDYLRSLGKPDYIEGITGKQNPETLGAFGASEVSATKNELDPLYEEAVEIVLQTDKASISSVQRHLRIGYNRAARMIEDMQAQGIVSEPVNGVRKVLGRRPNHR